MKYITFALVFCGAAVFAQDAAKPAEIAPDAVVLKAGSRVVTAGEFKKMLESFPPDIQQQAMLNPKVVMQSFFLMESLAKQAEAEKLDQASPLKEQLELQRMQTLAATIVNRQSEGVTVSDEDQKARYEAEKDTHFGQAKISAILVTYGDDRTIHADVNMADPKAPKPSLKKMRTEAEARAMAKELVSELRAGTPFELIAKEKSEDQVSAAKGGDFGSIKQSDRIPEEIKSAVFALKPGQVSDPVKQPNGFYILKVQERSVQPFEEAKTAVANEIRQERFQKWMSEKQKQFEVTVEKPAFFPAAPAKTAAK